MGLLIAVFLLTAGFATRAVRGYTTYVRTHSSVRELADLTANLHIGIYRYLLTSVAATDRVGMPTGESARADRPDWLLYARRDVEMQARLAETAAERKLWRHLHDALTALPDITAAGMDQASFDKLATQIDESLGSLRALYRKAEFDAIDVMTAKSELAQQAIWIAGGLIALVFLWYVILVRDWLVKPVATLKSAADSIGGDRFSGRIALSGTDELAQLARHLESMAKRLATHQAELLKARELSAVGELCTSVAHGP